MEIEAPRSHELDDETATLILQLQSEDIEELLNANKGKGRDGELSDTDLALATYQQELQAMNTILTEGDALEDTAHKDGSAAPESSAWAASRRKTSSTTYRHCTACDLKKPLFDVCQTPCGHFYCQECIQTLFELSTSDETLYPPRCCRERIPLQSVRICLSSAVVQTFEKKSIEFETSDRTFCSQPACSSFITADNITGEQATCNECGTQTCTICKSNAHDGDCPQDIATQQVLQMAREQGWQRCYNCRRLVEIDFGCSHMV